MIVQTVVGSWLSNASHASGGGLQLRGCSDDEDQAYKSMNFARLLEVMRKNMVLAHYFAIAKLLYHSQGLSFEATGTSS